MVFVGTVGAMVFVDRWGRWCSSDRWGAMGGKVERDVR
jgi:hypothetical protein